MTAVVVAVTLVRLAMSYIVSRSVAPSVPLALSPKALLVLDFPEVLFPEFELCVDSEAALCGEKNAATLKRAEEAMKKANIWEDAMTAGGKGKDADVCVFLFHLRAMQCSCCHAFRDLNAA